MNGDPSDMPVLSGLDHAVVLCRDPSSARESHEALFGRSADWVVASPEDGTESSTFCFENMELELLGPAGDGPVGARIRDLLEQQGEGLASLAFSTSDLAEAHNRLTRRGLFPSEVSEGQAIDARTGKARSWKRFRLEDAETNGIRTFVIQRAAEQQTVSVAEDQVRSLDHLVIATPNPERCLAQYGARLGLPLSLDRTQEAWKTRFLFFRTGGLTFEIVHRLDQSHEPSDPDTFYGTTWKVADIEAAHDRVSAQGFDVSEVRTGRKPGTKVFTVRSGTCGVPTLFLSQSSR